MYNTIHIHLLYVETYKHCCKSPARLKMHADQSHLLPLRQFAWSAKSQSVYYFFWCGKIPLNISPDLRHFFFSRWFSWWINSRHMWWYLCCWLSLESFCKHAGGGGGGGEGVGETGRQLLHPIFGLRLAASVHKSALQIHFNKYRNTKTNSNKIIKDECRSQTQAQFQNLMGSRSSSDFKRSLQNLPLP